MTEIKLDLYGSMLQAGVTSYLNDGAIRRAMVTGLPNDLRDMKTAINDVIAAAGIYHHVYTGLPLDRVRATRFGPSKAMLTLYYSRRAAPPLLPAEQVAKFRSRQNDPVPWFRLPYDEAGSPAYDSAGRPAGLIRGIDNINDATEVVRASPWIWQVPQVAIYVPTVLSFNPYPNVAQFVEKINADAIAFGGHTFAPTTMRFDAVDVDWYYSPAGGNTFRIGYAFTAKMSGWVQQSVYWNSGAGEIRTREYPTYQTVNFLGGFPAHSA